MEVVSPGQEDRDYEDKRRDYWDAGVREHWIADLRNKSLTVLTRGPNDWSEFVFAGSQTFKPKSLPGLEIPVGDLFS